MTIPYVTSDQLKNAADHLASTKEQGGCYHWKVCSQGDKDIAIVLGWTNGFDKDDPSKDKYQDDTWRLAVKVGYQPSNSMMQCDYDIDFNLPYNPDTGDVCDDRMDVCTVISDGLRILFPGGIDRFMDGWNHSFIYETEHWKCQIV